MFSRVDMYIYIYISYHIIYHIISYIYIYILYSIEAYHSISTSFFKANHATLPCALQASSSGPTSIPSSPIPSRGAARSTETSSPGGGLGNDGQKPGENPGNWAKWLAKTMWNWDEHWKIDENAGKDEDYEVLIQKSCHKWGSPTNHVWLWSVATSQYPWSTWKLDDLLAWNQNGLYYITHIV
jgi:hypothetical protein